MANYKSFIHVERLNTTEVNGILNGTCYITPKIDGTNACVYARNGVFYSGSRTRELSADNDNAGFDRWAQSDDPQALALKEFCLAHENYIVYGEWLGSRKFVGHIKDYNLDALGHLWVYDVYDTEAEHYLADDVWRSYFSNGVLFQYTVPYLCVKENPTLEELGELAENNSFLLDNANHPGEGIVIRNPLYRNQYGHYCVAKIVRDEFKQGKAVKKHVVVEGEVEQNIVSEYATDAELAKAVAKTVAYFDAEKFDNKQNKMVGFYLNMVMNDCIYEECAHWVKKFKVGSVDFNVLRKLTYDKARNYIGL